MSPNLARRTHERRLSPNRRALALEALMLLLLPPPKAITDVMIECTKNCARAGTEAVKMTPSAEERIDLLEQLSERLTSRRPLCLLLDRIAQGGLLVLGNLDPRHPSVLDMPHHSESMSKELEPSTQISDALLLINYITTRALA